MKSIESVMHGAQMHCCEEHGHIEPELLLDLAVRKRRSRDHHEAMAALLAELPASATPGSFVYFIEGAGCVKIGVTNNLASRFQTLQASSPVELTFVAAVPGDVTTERFLHGVFAAERRHGEWFALSARLLRFVVAAVQSDGAQLELIGGTAVRISEGVA